MTIIDLDDFCDETATAGANGLLMDLHREIIDFKVTLFTIPGRCSLQFIKFWQHQDWVDLVPHGWRHDTSRECQDWAYTRMDRYLQEIAPLKLTKGFKAPGWQISDGCYEALKDHGYWVADQEYNNQRRPKGMPTYLLDQPNKIHGHVGHLGGFNPNELSLILPAIKDAASKNGEFGFVRDALQ